MSLPHFCFLILSSLLVTGNGKLFSSSVPPRGWNSYDAFSWIISEEEFLQNAEAVSKLLLAHGYEYVVVDYLWYRRKIDGAYSNSLGYDVIDEWGRPVPDPDRFPSSKDANGFKSLADTVHKMGLKFGIHVMRGISTQAVKFNPWILDISTGGAYNESGREWRAADVGVKERICPWMSNGFMGVNTELPAGRAFLKSLYHQYAEWGVDFVKHDCVFGDNLDINEILIVSEALSEASHPILYSLSPGTNVTPEMAAKVNDRVNMYRITGDDWDQWAHVAAHFDVARDFAAAHLTGATGPNGKSWPDMDMLPLGWLTDPGSNEGPHRKCRLTVDEQWTQFPSISSTNSGEVRAWIATGRKGEVYVSFYNLSSQNTTISTTLPELAKALPKGHLRSGYCNYFEGYVGTPLGTVNNKISMEVVPHGSLLFILKCS